LANYEKVLTKLYILKIEKYGIAFLLYCNTFTKNEWTEISSFFVLEKIKLSSGQAMKKGADPTELIAVRSAHGYPMIMVIKQSQEG
jgi:hypothetical protein